MLQNSSKPVRRKLLKSIPWISYDNKSHVGHLRVIIIFILYEKMRLKKNFEAASERCSVNLFIKTNLLENVLPIFGKY